MILPLLGFPRATTLRLTSRARHFFFFAERRSRLSYPERSNRIAGALKARTLPATNGALPPRLLDHDDCGGRVIRFGRCNHHVTEKKARTPGTPSPRHTDPCRSARDRTIRHSRLRQDRPGALGRGTTDAATRKTPLIPDRSADASRSLRFAGNTRGRAGRLSARGHERPRTRPRIHEAARARPKRRPDLPSPADESQKIVESLSREETRVSGVEALLVRLLRS